MKEIITIVGGGSSAHVLIPFLTSKTREINILTSRPKDWNEEIKTEWQHSDGSIIKTFTGKLHSASSNPQDVIPQADIIILCLPVYKYKEVLTNIGQYINKNKKVYIGVIYGQGGFNWMVDEIITKYKLHNTISFAIGLIPWIARIKQYGSIGITYGSKSFNIVALSDSKEFKNLHIFFNDICNRWFNKGSFFLADNFISLTLSVDNQIIHTSRLYGLFLKYGGQWNKIDSIPYFYKDYDDLSADLLKNLDSDYSIIRNEIINMFPNKNYKYMLNYLELEKLSYQSCNENIKESFINSETLGAIKTPVAQNSGGFELNKDHRFFYDDIYYGLCIAKWIAQKLNLEVKTIDKILKWAEIMLNDKILDKNNFLVENKHIGLPTFYKSFTMDDINK